MNMHLMRQALLLQLKTWTLPGGMAYAFNPSNLEAAAGRLS